MKWLAAAIVFVVLAVPALVYAAPRVSENLKIAFIALVGVILTPVLGGLGAYLGSKELRQSDEERRTRAAARVLDHEFRAAAAYMQVMRLDNCWFPLDQEYDIEVSPDDLSRIAAHLHPQEWDLVEQGLRLNESFRFLVEGQLRGAERRAVPPSGRNQIASNIESVQAAVVALSDRSESTQPPPPVDVPLNPLQTCRWKGER
jgi:hypothetical protein